MKQLLEDPVVGTIGSEKFVAAVRWRNGVLITDEPEILGGRDLGPDPYTLLLSSLISCTLATLRLYIDFKELDFPEIQVEANMSHVMRSDGAVLRIEKHIIFPTAVDPELEMRLLRVADNCPVSNILKGNVTISSTIGTAGR